MDWICKFRPVGETDCMKGAETGVGRAPIAGRPTLADDEKTTGGEAEIFVTSGNVDNFWNAGVLVFVGLGEVSRG